jgi:hypothetical protein
MNVALGIYGVEHGLALENHPSQLWVAVAAAMSGLSVQTLMPPSSITSVPQGMCYTNALGRKGSVPTRNAEVSLRCSAAVRIAAFAMSETLIFFMVLSFVRFYLGRSPALPHCVTWRPSA